MLPSAISASNDDLLQAVLDVSLTGIIVFRPLYDPAEPAAINDLAYVHLNPAAQRMLQLPECPLESFLTLYPSAVETGIFAFYRASFLADGAGQYDVNYQADGLDNYFHLASRRAGDLLVVSFTDTADQSRSAVELALRKSQACEQQARAEADAQRQRLHDVLMALPALTATYHGPNHVYELVSTNYQRLFPGRSLPGQSIRDFMPELAGQGVFELLDHVYQTGEPYYGQEVPTQVDYASSGQLEQRYHNMYLQATRDAAGAIDGLLSFAYDVTEQVEARQQLQQLNAALEERVLERTHEAEVARAEAVEQRNRLVRLFGQAPAQINLFFGPDHLWTLVHPLTQELLPTRTLLGLPHRQALPELPESEHEIFDHVYRTGEPVHIQGALRRLDRYGNGELHEEYFDLTLQPKLDAAGQVEGVMSFAINVTERVLARQRAEALQAELLAAAQRQAQEREALFHILADTPAAVALLRGPEHRFEYVNAAYQRLFPERQLTGQTVAEALPETREAGFLAELDRVYRTGDTFFGQELPMRLQPVDGRPGQQVYYTFTYQAYQKNDQIAGISIFAFEVTEQVKARQQRETEREQLYGLFMEAPAPIVILDGPDFVFQLVNPAYQRIFPSRVLLGRPVLEALPEIAEAPIAQHLRQVYATGQTFVAQELPLQLARYDQGPLEELSFTFTYQARRNAQGVVDGVLVFAHEVTDQVRARQKIEESEARFRIMADAAPNQVWAVGPDSTIHYANQAFLDFVGMDLERYQQTGWLPYLHPEEFDTAQQTLETAIRTRTLYVLEHRMRRYDGQYRWLLSQGAPSYFPNGELYGYVGSAIDITELKETNEQLVRTNVDLDSFIYTASHDLKAPISNIEGLLYLLQEGLPPEVAGEAEVDQILARMLDAVERFKRTIDHLTEVSKLQKEHAPTATAVNLAAVVEDVRQDLRPQLQAADVQLVIEVSALPPVRFAEKNLRSIVYNLLSNAIKYRHPDRTPHVDVRAHVRPGHTVLEVHDNGLGLEAQHLPRLFTMFQRFHDHVEGTGIGLYMVKRMVENAGGRIEVYSQLGAGTTFFVFLPHAASPHGLLLPAFLPA
ncbi:PAS domain-containing protein [Hymenobacter negativus]|uniref:histidine kinase n=1 Tax=Hymenobacter negativus TaxID=2795026 RepID=A0ABS3QMD1_9BACT|nr:PAS domain-containing protein [Hymenobacter negativus]MBO2012098.1 PAS domain-containing protein [Hymenobacter negativus]